MNPTEVRIEAYGKETYSRHQRTILSYFGCSPFDETAKAFISKEIAALVRVQFRSKMVLLESIQVLTRKKIAIPSYNVLADLIVSALNLHQRSLSETIDGCLSDNLRTGLDDLLEKEPGNETGEGWRYCLTLLKKPYQSTRPAKIRANLSDLDTVQSLYLALKPVVQRLDLSYECIRHYAYSVIKTQIPQVSRRADEDRFLHLIAFVVFQTFRLNDTLIDIMLSVVSLVALVERFRKNVRETLSAIRHIVSDAQLGDSQKLALIDVALNAESAKPAQFEQKIDEFKQNAIKLQQGPDNFALLEARSLKLQHRVADIVRQVQFAPNCSKPACGKPYAITSRRMVMSTRAPL